MQIQLTQNEIKDAIREYVLTGLGFNLTGKSLAINFTATRGEAGVMATLFIEKTVAASDVVIPGYTDTPSLTEVAGNDPVADPEPEADPADVAVAAAIANTELVEEAEVAEVAEAVEEVVKPAATTSSLFKQTPAA